MSRLASLALLLLSFLVGCGRSGAPVTPAAPDVEGAGAVLPITTDREATGCSLNIISAQLPDSYRYGLAVASASFLGNVASYSWNFGGGTFPNTSTLASPMVKLTGYGNYNGSLTVYDTCGLPRTRSFTYIIYPYLYGSYAPTAPSPATIGPVVYEGDMTALGSTMAIASYDVAGGSLRYAQGINQLAWIGNWNNTHLVDGAGDTGLQPSIVVANGAIKIAYYDRTASAIRLAQATVPNPTNSAHWHLQTVTTLPPLPSGRGAEPCLTWSNQGLAISYSGANDDDDLRVLTSLFSPNPLFPTTATDWINLGAPPLGPFDETDEDHSIALVNDRIYLCYSAYQFQAMAAKIQFASYRPISDPGWQLHTIDPTGNVSSASSTVFGFNANGFPVVAYHANNTDSLRVATATSAVPTSAASWTSHTALSGFGYVKVLDMLYNDGKLCIAFRGQDPDVARRTAVYQGAYDGSFVYIAQATTAVTTDRKHWTCIPVGSGTPASWNVTPTWPQAPSASLVSFPATGIDRLSVLYDQPAPGWQTYAASYVPNPPPIQ